MICISPKYIILDIDITNKLHVFLEAPTGREIMKCHNKLFRMEIDYSETQETVARSPSHIHDLFITTQS